MEKIAGDMSGLLQETLDLYQDLKHVLVMEKNYITQMDIKQLWTSTEKKKQLVQSIEGLTREIINRAKRYAAHFDMTVQNFRVREVISALPLRMQVKSKLKSLGLKIDCCKKEITLLAYENKKFIIEYLSVVDGIFSTIRQGGGQDQYSKSGQVYQPAQQTRLIHAQV